MAVNDPLNLFEHWQVVGMHSYEFTTIQFNWFAYSVWCTFSEQSTVVLLYKVQQHAIAGCAFQLSFKIPIHSKPHYTDQKAIFSDHLIVTTSIEEFDDTRPFKLDAWLKRNQIHVFI